MGQLGIGLIGAGAIADLHAKAINQLDSAKLVGIWDINRETTKTKASWYHCQSFDAAQDLCNSPEVDAILVLTPMEFHCEYVIMAAKAGKHVLVEKPVASTISEIQEMLQAVKDSGIKCMPGHNYIYEDSVRRAKQMIDQGKLGPITQFYMMYNIHHADDIRARYPGVIRQILTHHAYTMLYLAGMPKSVSCMRFSTSEQVSQENVAMATIQMENGSLSHLCASFANDDHSSDPWTCIIKVMGTKGSSRYSYRDWVIYEKNGPHSQTYFAYPETIANELQFFVEKVVMGDEPPLSSLEDALICQQVMEACEQSATDGKHITLDIKL
jgi:predicted dehydrogenase